MGVDGLLKFLSPIITHTHLSSFRSKTAAIDMSSWLYRACYNAADQMNSQQNSIAFLYYINQLIDLLEYYQIKIICVFDGRFLKHKEKTIQKRRNERENNRKKGEELIEKGQEQEAKKYINRVLKIDQRIIRTTMQALKGRNIDFIVSPYESDCQMAKLFYESQIDFAICQDSDLIIYGVPVLLKLSTEGDCDYLDINDTRAEDVENVFVKDFIKLDKIRRTQVAVLTGTDYLPSIKGIGIKRALKFVTQSKDLKDAIKKIEEVQKYKKEKPQGYEQKAQQAMLIFLFGTAYSIKNQRLKFLNEDTDILSKLSPDLPLQKLKNLVGNNYNYDESVRTGTKQVWSLQDRDLTPLVHDKKIVLNLSALRDKELSFENLKVVENFYAGKSPIINREQNTQHELRMMCEARQLQLKKEKFNQLTIQLQANYERLQPLRRCPSKQKLEQFKSKFPAWMTYCPQKAQDNFQGPIDE